MSGSTPTTATARWWIDALIIGVGAAALTQGWPAPAGALFILGLAFPLLRAVGMNGRSVEHALRFVPADLVHEHRRVRRAATAAAKEPSVARAVEIADEVALEAAAIFAGRPVRGAVHRRYVRQRCGMLRDLAHELEERTSALAAARAELEHLDVVDIAPLDPAPRSDYLATILLWLMAPLFIVWELGAAGGRVTSALMDGIALRLRTVLRLVFRAFAASGRVIRTAGRRWREARTRFIGSWTEARRQFTAARFRLSLRMRRARRAV